MQYEMTGTVKKIYDTVTFASGFSKREFVLTDEDDRFPQEIALAVLKDDCSKLDNVQIGERLRVLFRIRGREYNGRHFVNLEAYRLEHLDAEAAGLSDQPDEFDDIAPVDDAAMPF